MIQKEEYLKALEIVEQYHKQLELQIVMHNGVKRETVDEWINRNEKKLTGRLIKCLTRDYFDRDKRGYVRSFNYIDEVNHRSFIKQRGNGLSSWIELSELLRKDSGA